MWRSAFLHEFIDHRIDNYQALEGNPTPRSLLLTPTHDAALNTNAVRISGRLGFEHVLEIPLQEVIGISCRARLLFPVNQGSQRFPVFRLGGAAAIYLFRAPGASPDATVALLIGSTRAANLGKIELPTRGFVECRFDWHTTGQARVLVGGRLVAYHNNVAPGAMLTVDQIGFGAWVPSTASYRIDRVFVRVLQRSTSAATFSKLLPPIDAPDVDRNRCRRRVLSNLVAMVGRLHGFMASFHQSSSQPWTRQDGPAAGPFQPEATQAHALATKSVAELATMLRTDDFSAPDRFLDPFTEFVRILHDALPAQFEALAEELAQREIVPPDCRTVFEPRLRKNKAALAPLIDLLTQAAERVRYIAGGNAHG